MAGLAPLQFGSTVAKEGRDDMARVTSKPRREARAKDARKGVVVRNILESTGSLVSLITKLWGPQVNSSMDVT